MAAALRIEVQWRDEPSADSISYVNTLISSKLVTIPFLCPGDTLGPRFLPAPFRTQVTEVSVCDVVKCPVIPMHCRLIFDHYVLNRSLPSTVGNAENETSFVVYNLPSHSLRGLWSSLTFAGDIKNKIISYADRALELALRGAQRTAIAYHKVMLMSGPPGTGKTSICRALAQKMSVRMQNSHPTAQLVELNAQSLLSKWFSESGKQVKQIFSQLRDIASDPAHLVFVLIDEVETLTTARSAASSAEPGDAVRAVNAVLTELDNIAGLSNIFVLATSNLIGKIDSAFLDRVDLSIHIGEPDACGRTAIIAEGLAELQRCHLVSRGRVPWGVAAGDHPHPRGSTPDVQHSRVQGARAGPRKLPREPPHDGDDEVDGGDEGDGDADDGGDGRCDEGKEGAGLPATETATAHTVRPLERFVVRPQARTVHLMVDRDGHSDDDDDDTCVGVDVIVDLDDDVAWDRGKDGGLDGPRGDVCGGGGYDASRGAARRGREGAITGRMASRARRAEAAAVARCVRAVVEGSAGRSGRWLRKLPLLALSRFGGGGHEVRREGVCVGISR